MGQFVADLFGSSVTKEIRSLATVSQILWRRSLVQQNWHHVFCLRTEAYVLCCSFNFLTLHPLLRLKSFTTNFYILPGEGKTVWAKTVFWFLPAALNALLWGLQAPFLLPTHPPPAINSTKILWQVPCFLTAPKMSSKNCFRKAWLHPITSLQNTHFKTYMESYITLYHSVLPMTK